MARDPARIGHLEARGDRDLTPRLNLKDFAKSVTVGS